MTVTLVCCVQGEAYERYARALGDSVREHFHPGDVQFVRLESPRGWPHASAGRYRTILNNLDHVTGDFVFLVDADSRFEANVGPEILADGITVTTHPGFPDPGQEDAPWIRDPDSRAFVSVEQSADKLYHPGAFVGGERRAFLDLATFIAESFEADVAADCWPRWYDESYLNRYLIDNPPALILPGDYCYWDYWGQGPGPHGERRVLVHLDKTAAEFYERDNQDAA